MARYGRRKYITQRSQRRHKATAHRLVKKIRAPRSIKRALHKHIKKA